MGHWLFSGGCVETMQLWPGACFDSAVTDPPYELGFMAKRWDASGVAFSVEMWSEVLRVLKPGAFLLAFGGTRTYHRMTCAIEDAGFEIRDSLHWIYGTGFPKSLNVGEGRGTALKPAHEPIVLARKSLIGTVAANVLAHGTGALNIDACRVAAADGVTENRVTQGVNTARTSFAPAAVQRTFAPSAAGRWPANVLLDEDAAAELDAQSGTLTSGGFTGNEVRTTSKTKSVYNAREAPREAPREASSGGASRFFYVAKPSRRERDLGCESLPASTGGEATDREDGSAGTQNPRAGAGRTGGARNIHPTVKPIALMRYLVRLVTPPNGVVLDPFMGSGTTGIAALAEGVNFVGIEKEEEYLKIAELRMGAK